MTNTPSIDTSPRGAKAVAVMAAAGIAVHLAMRLASYNLRHWADVPLYVTLLAGGLPLVVQLARKLWAWEFGSDFLAGVSIVTAVLLRQYLVGAIVVLMLSGGTALEEYASRRASHVLDELAKRMPGIAHRKAEQGLIDIQAQDIVVGDTLVVLPHEICRCGRSRLRRPRSDE